MATPLFASLLVMVNVVLNEEQKVCHQKSFNPRSKTIFKSLNSNLSFALLTLKKGLDTCQGFDFTVKLLTRV
jgi:hypothetical protein